MNNQSAKRATTLVAVCLLLSLAGCSGGKKTTDVSGTVKYQNKDLPIAEITFISDKGKPVSGLVQDGKFTVKGVPVGDNVKVVINTSKTQEEISQQKQLEQNPDFVRIKAELLANPEKMKDKFKDDAIPPSLRDKSKMLDPEMLARSEKHFAELEQKLVPVPPKYEKPEKTPLSYTITAQQKDLDIVISD